MEHKLSIENLPIAVYHLGKKMETIESLLLENRVKAKSKDKAFITVSELSDLLDLAKPTIYSNYSKGLIPGGCKQGKKILFESEVIHAWIKEGRKKTNAEIEAASHELLTAKKRDAI